MPQNRLLVLSPLYPPHQGGLESHAEQFNFHMAKLGYVITVFTPQVIRGSKWQENHDGVKIVRFPAFEIIPNYPVPKFWKPFFWKQWREVWKQDFDVVISRTRFFLTSLMALAYAKIKRIPWLHVEHGSDYVHLNSAISSGLAKVYDKTLGRLVFLTADKIVANSQASALFVRQLVSRPDVSVIYRGIEWNNLLLIKPDTSITKLTGQTVITYVGRLIDGKGVDTLLEAAAQLKERDTLFLVIGSGPQRDILEKQTIDLGLTGVVKFLGSLSWEKAISIIKSSDIVVNPSFTEGLPTSIIEAAACGKAIIASNVGGTSEIIENNRSGILFVPGNVSELVSALKLYLDRPDLQKLYGNTANMEIINKFHWDRSIKFYHDILLKLYA